MQIEYEATYLDVDKDEVRNRLKKAHANLVKPEFLQRRWVWHLPQGHEIPGSWVRVRDEGGQITMSVKIVDGRDLEDQKEVMIKVDDFEKAREILNLLGCQERAYQETKRELWNLNGVEITIDEWPFLEPFVEIEGNSEKQIKEISEKIGFDYNRAQFGSADYFYAEKYNISIDVFNKKTPRLTFEMQNPFIKKS
ncbi:CYTH domain-containing protein [Candidatus Nomurabacteria bacterium]|nr:CYTH domain-containing protein [Candidatus Nomurabacteria bacterium]